MLNIAIPNKGRLSQKALEILHKIGLKVGSIHERRLVATIGKKYKILFVRASDIPEFVQNGTADVGITGLDLIEEKAKDVERLLTLDFGRCRLVVAAKEHSEIQKVEDIMKGAAVATAFPKLTEQYFKDQGKDVKIVHVSGATEITPHIGVADLITDLTETGSTLVMNHLREIDTILDSMAMFIANKDAQVDVNGIITVLKSLGGTGILVLPIERMVMG